MIATLLAATFFALGLLHVYWAFGGRLDGAAVTPCRTVVASSGAALQMPAFVPSRRDTLLVAAARIAAAALVAIRAGLFTHAVTHWAVQTACIGISVVFLARAVGDFRFVGFFKPDNGTAFAYWDTRLYSPLCVALAGAAANVAGC